LQVNAFRGAVLLAFIATGGCRKGASEQGGPGKGGDSSPVDTAAFSRSDVCSGTGRFIAAETDPCPPLAEVPAIPVASVDVSLQSYAGPGPRCDDADQFDKTGPAGSSFRFRVELPPTIVDSRAGGATEIAVQGSVISFDKPCGVTVEVVVPYGSPGGGPGATIEAAIGTVWRIDRRLTTKGDAEVLSTNVISSDMGEVLLANVNGAREDFFDSDLLRGLKLGIPDRPICKGRSEGSLNLSTGDGTCSLQSRTQRCCQLWGSLFEVQSQGVILGGAAKPSPALTSANVSLRRRGFVKIAGVTTP
jgi:hypothetical protein